MIKYKLSYSSYAKTGRPAGSVGNLKTVYRFTLGSDLGEVTRFGTFFTHSMPRRGERPCHGKTEVDFTIHEGKRPLSPSHGKQKGKHRRTNVRLKTKTKISCIDLAAV